MLRRAALSVYYIVDRVMISRDSGGNATVIVPDKDLLGLLVTDSDFDIREYDPLDRSTVGLKKIFPYGNRLDEGGWYPLTDNNDFYDGKVIRIQINDSIYPVLINRELLPVKLKKAEFVDIDYRIFLEPPILGIRKRFQVLENYGFTLMRLFKII